MKKTVEYPFKSLCLDHYCSYYYVSSMLCNPNWWSMWLFIS